MNCNELMNNKDSELLEFLKCALGCAYISDLRNVQHIDDVKLILSKLDLAEYSDEQVVDAWEYIYGEQQ